MTIKRKNRTIQIAKSIKGININVINTEKSHKMLEQGVYTFKVPFDVKKTEIKREIELLFDVHVATINTVSVRAKETNFKRTQGHQSSYKKVYIKLVDGEKINL